MRFVIFRVETFTLRPAVHILLASLVWIANGSLLAQVDREGLPVTWNAQGPGQIWQDLAPLDINGLIAEDQSTSGLKTLPFRFAEAREVNFTLNNSGEWKNFSNGDRVWLLPIRCENALGMSVTFGSLDIPQGGTVYLFNEERTDFIGPFTARNNRINEALGSASILGNNIVIEYYEPFSQRGDGSLRISSVACAYRDMTQIPVFPGNDCLEVFGESPSKEVQDASSSVFLVIVDNGQRIATASMINNAGYDATPYAITAIQALVGDPASWVFVHQVSGDCPAGQLCWDEVLSGAEVLAEDGETGIALLRLMEQPRRSWEVYLNGWNLSLPQGSYTVMGHSYGARQSIAESQESPVNSFWSVFETVEFPGWDEGGVFPGAIGAPLFDKYHKLVGVFVGGDWYCSSSGKDHFGLISGAWEELREYLDPYQTGSSLIPGQYTTFEARDEQEGTSRFVIYPNPAVHQLFIQNLSGEPVERIDILDATGRIVLCEFPQLLSFDVSSLESGHYFIRLVQAGESSVYPFIVR